MINSDKLGATRLGYRLVPPFLFIAMLSKFIPQPNLRAEVRTEEGGHASCSSQVAPYWSLLSAAHLLSLSTNYQAGCELRETLKSE